MSTPLPIACTLTAEELSAERETLLPGLAAHAVARSALPGGGGIRLLFTATAERLRQIATVVERETRCCPFLAFHVGLSLGSASLTLDVTGPAGTDHFLEALLDTELAV